MALPTFTVKFIERQSITHPWQTHMHNKLAHTHISAVVVSEIVWAGLLRYRRRGFWDGDVLKVKKAELHLHADESI